MVSDSAFTGIVTAEGGIAAISGGAVSITSFGVSDTAGSLDINRTSLNPSIWYYGTLTTPGAIQDGEVYVELVIPPNSVEVPIPSEPVLAEIGIYASLDGGAEFLFAIVHPPDSTPITLNNTGSFELDTIIIFSNSNIAGNFTFVYNIGSVTAHDIDINAHQKRWVLKAGDTMTGALHEPKPVAKASVSGVLTLTEASNSFIATGTETITSITGWTNGLAKIRWNTSRTLTYNGTSLILIGGTNRVTQVGDVGVYEFTSSGCREVSYFPATGYALKNGNGNNLFSVANGQTAYNAVNVQQLEDVYPLSGKPLTVLYGNLNFNTGYPNIINKVSDTEVSFNVGGIYNNLIITGKDCRKYEITSISNVTISTAAGTYVFIIELENLTDNGDGTYTATATAVNSSINTISEGYTYPDYGDTQIIPSMTSNTSGGWTLTNSSTPAPVAGYDAYKSADSNNSTYNSFQVPVGSVGVVAYPITNKPWVKYTKDSGTFDLKKVGFTPYNAANSPTGIKIYDQSDNLLYTWVATSLDWVNGVERYFDIDASGLSGIKVEYTHSYANSAYVYMAEVKIYTTTSAVEGDLNTLINQLPYNPEKRVSGVWTNHEFVKIGEVTIQGGVMGTPITYAFNRRAVVRTPITYAASSFVHNHNLGIDPKHIKATVKAICTTADAYHEVGAVVEGIANAYSQGTYVTSTPVTLDHTKNYSTTYMWAGTYYITVSGGNWHALVGVDSVWDFIIDFEGGF